MQRTIVRQKIALERWNLFERTIYISLLSGFLVTTSYLVIHCYHTL